MAKHKQYHTRKLYFSNRTREALGRILQYPMTIVEAPMGYGKTTAVKAYLMDTEATVLWQVVYDNYTQHFWHTFSKHFEMFDCSCAKRLEALGVPNDKVSRVEAIKIIKEVNLTGETVIVIEDYHLIDQIDVNAFLLFLIKNQLPHLHIVVTSRHGLFDNLNELKLKGYVHHISKQVLELTISEVANYYKICGIVLKGDQAERLYKYTEGWISALYLCMLTFTQKGNFESEMAEGSGLIRDNIEQLLENAVYEPLSQEMKPFLLAISILENFTLEEAAYVWGKKNTEEYLKKLLLRNAFVTYDCKTQTYRMHNMLTGFLRERLNRQEVVCQTELYKRAGEWSLEAGRYFTAMAYFYKAKEYALMLDALERDRGNSIFVEQKECVRIYFEQCPKIIRMNHPVSLLIYAMCLFTFNEMESFQETCGEFLESIYHEQGGMDATSRKWLLGEYQLLMSFSKYNNIVEMTAHLKKACDLLKAPSIFMDTRGGWTFGSPSILYMFYREVGELGQHVVDLRESMPYYGQLTNGHGMGAEYSMEAERYLYLGEFENAEMVAHKALYMAKQKKQSEIIICALFVQARCALVRGDFPTVQEVLEKMHGLRHMIDLCHAYIYALLKEVTDIPEWIVEGDFHSERLYFPTRAFANIVYGRVLLIRGAYLKVLGSETEFLEVASVFPNVLGIIYTKIYSAAAYEKIFRRVEALDVLREALEISSRDCVYLPFVENGDYIEALLAELKGEGIYETHIHQILTMYGVYKEQKRKIKIHYFDRVTQRLTDREMKIARLAADGLTNREIGEILYSSENTVKAQLKSIFEKLGINSRALLEAKLQKNNSSSTLRKIE